MTKLGTVTPAVANKRATLSIQEFCRTADIIEVLLPDRLVEVELTIEVFDNLGR
jgi:hypothetical protein